MIHMVMKMKRFILLLLVAALTVACFGCGAAQDAAPSEEPTEEAALTELTALIGMPLSEAKETLRAAQTDYDLPYVWRVADGYLAIGAADDKTISSVVRFSEEGKVTEQIDTAVLTDADPSQWPDRTTHDLYAQIGEPPYDLGVGYYGRQTASYLTVEGKICYLYVLDGRVSHVLVRDVFSDATEIYPSGRSRVEEGASVTLIWRGYDNNVEQELTEEEAAQVVAILDGKERYSYIPSELMCGFYDYLAFRVGDRLFCPGFDGCCTVMEYDTGLYFDISQAERDAINALLSKYAEDYPFL